MRDSWGISGTGETPPAQSAREAHRTPPGKGASGTEINHSQKHHVFAKKRF
ncbi:hypothetical protein ABID52_004084 [Fictibacillus halophilus]|uniref:Uncharacterized protein n=1 Tax=Fictibacillus halophilus TaxID=1610490 RepID=A0ABV2LPC7_9BACL